MSVTVTRRVIDLSERGLRGRDGVSGDFIALTQSNTDPNTLVLGPADVGAAYGTDDVFSFVVEYEPTAESWAAEVATLTDDDPRQFKLYGSTTNFDPRVLNVGDTVLFKFVVSGAREGVWDVLAPANTVQVASQSEVNTGTDTAKAVSPATLKGNQDLARRLLWAGRFQLPSTDAPGILEYVEDNRIVITLKPQAAHYRDGYASRYDDVAIFEMRQLAGTYHAAGSPIWTLLSIFSRFSGEETPHANFSWSSFVSGQFDTRQSASTNEQVWFYGKTADSAATIMAAGGSGPYHGNIVGAVPTLTVNGGILNGVIIPDGTNVLTLLKPGDVLTFTQFDISQTWGYKTPDGTQGMASNVLHRFAPLLGNQLTIASQSVFGGAGYKAAVAYMAMLAQRVGTWAQARSVGGTVGTKHTIGLGAGATINFGQAQRITTGQTDKPGPALDLEINDTYAPYKVGGVQAAYSVDTIGLDNEAGMKIYVSAFQGSLDTDDVTGLTFEQLVYYNAVMADGA